LQDLRRIAAEDNLLLFIQSEVMTSNVVNIAR